MKIYRQNFENLHIEEVQDEIKKVETPAKVMYVFKINLKSGDSTFMYLNHNVVLQIIDNINNNTTD